MQTVSPTIAASDVDPEYDVLICGGGMVGASLAAALAKLRLRTLLVEAVPFANASQPSFDARTIALSRGSCRILESLGVWPAIASAAAPIRQIHVSERGSFGSAVLDANRLGVPLLGAVIENRLLGTALWDALSAPGQGSTLRLACPAVAVDVDAAGDANRISVRVRDGSDEKTVAARLLVVADGARSQLRDRLGVAARRRAYGQTAIIGNVQASRPGSGDIAFERFTAEGPLALLPTGAGRFAFVLTLRTDAAEHAAVAADEDFLALLQRTFGQRLGRFARLGRRTAYPLELVQSDAVTAPRTVFLGNAAHALHPVAGQGYNLGLRDAAVLAELIADGLAAGSTDPGTPECLERYRRWRQTDQRDVVAFTDGLVRLFDLDLPGVGAARGLGLLAFDMAPAAKRWLARRTMGQAGRVSRLARGLTL